MWIKPRLLVMDESEFWDEDIIKKAEKIYGIYLYDANYRVHICSFQASNEIYSLGFEIKNYVDDETYDDITQGWNDGTALVDYMNVASGKEEHKNSLAMTSIQCKEAEYEETMKEVVEGYREGVNTGNLSGKIYSIINRMGNEGED